MLANVAQLPFLIIRRHRSERTTPTRIAQSVRRNKVLGSITWLQNNNPFYADIEIDQEALQQLPAHGVPEHLPTLDDPDANLEPLLLTSWILTTVVTKKNLQSTMPLVLAQL